MVNQMTHVTLHVYHGFVIESNGRMHVNVTFLSGVPGLVHLEEESLKIWDKF